MTDKIREAFEKDVKDLNYSDFIEPCFVTYSMGYTSRDPKVKKLEEQNGLIARANLIQKTENKLLRDALEEDKIFIWDILRDRTFNTRNTDGLKSYLRTRINQISEALSKTGGNDE